MMRMWFAGVSAAAMLAGGAACAQDVTLQLKWVTQAQFAGYYVAQEQGFYEEEGLNVTIKPGGPDVAPPQVIAGGGADVVIDWMPSALAAREKGLPLVNIAQPFKRSGMMLTCRNDSGVTATENFPGHTLGVWFGGNEYPFLSWMSKLGYSTEGGADGVTVLKQGFNVDPLLQNQAACISTMTYNEYWQVIDAGLTPEELTVFKYEDQGVATLEDGLYVLEELSGYVIGCGAAFLTGVLADRVAFLRAGLLPVGNFASALPIVGMAPIMVMWFGFDWQSKAAVVVLMVFFPMLVNTVQGLSAADHMQRDLMRTYAASYPQTLRRLQLPAAAPFLFNGLKICTTLALIGAIVAEFFGSPTVGMGFRISTEVGRLALDMVWAEIVVAAIVGSAFYGAVALIERAVTFWHPSQRS